MLRGDAPRGRSKQQQEVSIRFLRRERTSKKFSVRVGEGATKIRDERHDRRDLRLPMRLACGCERNAAIQARPSVEAESKRSGMPGKLSLPHTYVRIASARASSGDTSPVPRYMTRKNRT
jgi:hypothetical protein